MGRKKVTTVQMDFETSRKLGEIAKKENRSKAQQMTWMVDLEFAKLVDGNKPKIAPQPAKPDITTLRGL